MECNQCFCCKDIFDQDDRSPRLLPCHHTVCQACLGKVLKIKPECPCCKTKLEILEAKNFPLNYQLHVNLLNKRPALDLPKCSVCGNAGSQYACMELMSFICEKCFDASHLEHKIKKIQDLHGEVIQKLETRRETIDKCKKRSDFFESVLEHFVNKIKTDLATKTSALISAILENQEKINAELDKIESQSKKRINLEEATFEYWDINKLKAKDFFAYNTLDLDDWETKAQSYCRGDLFYESFKEIAHLDLIWDKILDLDKIEKYFYIDVSNCEKKRCHKVVCDKLDEYSKISSEIIEYSQKLSLEKKNVVRNPKICDLISEKFMLSDLEKFQEEFIYFKNKLEIYKEECRIEIFRTDMIENINKILNYNTSKQILEHYEKELQKFQDKDDEDIFNCLSVNSRVLEKIPIQKNESYKLFIFSILLNYSFRFYFRHLNNNDNNYLNSIKVITRKLCDKNDQIISVDEVNGIFKQISINLSSQSDIRISFIQTFLHMFKEIQNSFTKNDDLIEKIASVCSSCQSTSLKSKFSLEIKSKKLILVQFSSYTSRKKFDFLLNQTRKVDDIIKEVSKLAPEINPSCLIVLDQEFRRIKDEFISHVVHVFEGLPEISSNRKLMILIDDDKSQSKPFYYIEIENEPNGNNHNRDEIIKKIVGQACEQEYEKVENYQVESHNSEKSSSSNLPNNSNLPISKVHISRQDKKDPIFISQNNVELKVFSQNSLCINCEKCQGDLALISNLPKTFIAHMNTEFFQYKSFKFELNEIFAPDFPQKLKAILVQTESPVPSYITYFIGPDQNHYELQSGKCAMIDKDKVLYGQPLIMMYSSHD